VLHRLRDDVEAADVRIRPYVRETPLDRAPALSQAWGAEVYLKLENTQITGSFKLRGAVNRILTTPMSQRVLGVVAASTGNHGVAVAHAAQVLRVPGTVFVPDGAPAHKLAAIRARGAEVVVHGRDSLDAEREARRYAQERGLVYLSPYNDPQVIAGQGTIAAELVRQIERTDVVVVAVGGGGLVSGIAGYLKGTRRDVTVIGCSPSASRVMYESVRAGLVLDLPSEPTFSDGTAGGIEPDAITFPLCRTLVDEWVLVSEEEIAAAVRLALDHEHQLVEGAAGVALATAGKLASRFPGGNLVIVVCGGNIGVETLRRILG
jgi:threonine dehydratase